ncbi:MAG: D-2-hydroxyacid dehydrogenase [Dehalococcoidia bacterium]|nr:D-2-hydroxyacid dehydrogenase [Dehalococcoidia bacterium]
MDKINVGVTFNAAPEITAMIQGVSPRIAIKDITALASEERKSGAPSKELDRVLADLEVLLLAQRPQRLIQRAPKLKWAHYFGTGVDFLAEAGLDNAPFIITNTTGTNSKPIAESCFLFMLMFVKRAPGLMENKRLHAYNRPPVIPDFLEGKTLGVLGMGQIGLEVAHRGRAFSMRVLGYRRSIASIERHAGDFEAVYPGPMLTDLLGQCDFVVSALPLTKETTRIIGERELRAMKPTAYLINVGRGKLIDEPVLVRALQEGWIAGAGLDVFEREPLPANSPLWDLPTCLISPHVTGETIDHRLRATRFFCDQLRRYVAGQPLKNIIDPAKGY